jgi:hypothetical protein
MIKMTQGAWRDDVRVLEGPGHWLPSPHKSLKNPAMPALYPTIPLFLAALVRDWRPGQADINAQMPRRRTITYRMTEVHAHTFHLPVSEPSVLHIYSLDCIVFLPDPSSSDKLDI